jgi:hypothetical protein
VKYSPALQQSGKLLMFANPSKSSPLFCHLIN